MSSLASLQIDLNGLKDGQTVLDYDLDERYLEAVQAPDIHKGNFHVTVVILRTDKFFDLKFHTQGTAIIPCDKCLDDMEQPILTDNRLAVKFGETYAEEDELVTVAEDEGILDLSWFICEFIELAIPIRHVHAPGKCNSAMMRVLLEHSASRRDDAEGEKPIDPRWAALLKMKE